MKKKILSIGVLSIIVVAMSFLSGCSCLLPILTLTSPQYIVKENIGKMDLDSIPQGRQIIVDLDDGNSLIGEYSGVSNFSGEEYAERYNKILGRPLFGTTLPSLGDTITLASKTTIRINLKFLGFGHKYILISSIEAPDTNRLNLEHIKTISVGDTNVIEGEKIRELMYGGQIPLLTAITVRDRTGSNFIPIDEVERIQINAQRTDPSKAFLIGLGVDAVILGFLGWQLHEALSHM